MPFKAGNEQFTGTCDGVCGYVDRKLNVYRGASSLSGERVKNDPAFRGFLKSGHRMQEASPLLSMTRFPNNKKDFDCIAC